MATNEESIINPTSKGLAMFVKLTALSVALFIGVIAALPASASTNDPSSPFYLLPTKSQGTTLHEVQR